MSAPVSSMPQGGARLQWSRRTTLLLIAALLACALVLHREVIFGGAVYHMDDAADGYYPGHIAVRRAFAHGELPTWERGSWCGWPLVVDPYNGVFYPPNVIYYLVGAARGLGFAIVLHILLGGLGVLWLLKRRGLAPAAALFGALAYELSTFGVVRIRHVIFVQMMAYLPFILVGVEGWLASRRRRELALVAVSTGLALVAGALSIGHFAALVIAGYTVARLVPRRRDELRRALLDGGALIGAAFVGALLAAVQLAPTLAHLPHSPRALGSDYAFASSYAWPNLRYLATLVAPDLFGTEDRFHYYGAPNHWELCGWYVGAACVVLSPLALVGRRGRGEKIVLAGLVLLGIGLALGDAGPVHGWFFRHVPLYAALRCPARALLMAVLALPVLGAEGLDFALSRLRPSRRTVGAAAAIALAAASITAAILLARASHLRVPPIVSTERAAWSHFAWAAGLAFACIALVAAGVRRGAAGLLACAVLAADLLVVGRGYLVPQPADYPEGMERFAALEWVRAHADGARFVNDPAGPFRLHNVGMVYGLENASGYDSVGVWRYVELLYLLAHGHRYPYAKLKDDFAGIGVHNLTTPMLDAMNVRYLIGERAPDARWVLRFQPPSPSGAPAAKYEPQWDARLRVFENTRVLPRAFVAYRAVALPDEQLAKRLVDPSFDPHREILVEDARYAIAAPPREVQAATLAFASRKRLVIDAQADAPALLFVGDVFYPGWRATVDGKPAPLLRADWAFRAVPLSPGRHRVEMTYASRPVAVGAALSGLGFALLCALGLLRRRPVSVLKS